MLLTRGLPHHAALRGDMTVDIKRTDQTYSMNLVSPEGTTAVVGVPETSTAPNKIADKASIVWHNGAFTDKLPGISWNAEDKNYLKFNVAPGAWSSTVLEFQGI